MPSLNLTFTPPTPAPASGYSVSYRVAGSSTYQTLSGLTGSPVQIPNVQPGTDYEGYLTSLCLGQQPTTPFTYRAPVPCVTVTHALLGAGPQPIYCTGDDQYGTPQPFYTDVYRLVATIPTPYQARITVSCKLYFTDPCSGESTFKLQPILIEAGQTSGLSTYHDGEPFACPGSENCLSLSYAYTNEYTQSPTCN